MEPVSPREDFNSLYGMRVECLIYDDRGILIGGASACLDYPEMDFSEVTKGFMDQELSRRGIISSSAIAIGYRIQIGAAKYIVSRAVVAPEYGISFVTLRTDRATL